MTLIPELKQEMIRHLIESREINHFIEEKMESLIVEMKIHDSIRRWVRYAGYLGATVGLGISILVLILVKYF